MNEAILEKGFSANYVFIIVVGFIFLLVGIIGYRYWDILNSGPQVVKRSELDNY